MSARPLSRRQIATVCALLLGLFIAVDAQRSGLPDPFRAPPALALGSGASASGAHCTAP
jgi:hypothetical protein